MFVRASVAENTWKKHKSAWQCVKCYSRLTLTPINWPMQENFICEFAAWALKEKELMPSTVTSYLSSLSTIHELCAAIYYSQLPAHQNSLTATRAIPLSASRLGPPSGNGTRKRNS
jgi:hypothetical protein